MPKWAQDELRVLRMRVDEWKSRATDGPKGSDTFVHRYAVDVDDSGDKPLGRGETIRFILKEVDGDRFNRHYVDVRVRNGQVYVQAGDTIKITPYSSNAVHVEVAE